MADLREQGGIRVVIDPFSVNAYSCGGDFGEIRFAVTWVHGVFMLLTMSAYSQELVDAFAKVLEYEPFCRYTDENGLSTVEWDKRNPDGRYIELEADSANRDVMRLPVAASESAARR